MANLSKKNGIFLARFRFRGKEYKKSLKTRSRKAAEAAIHRIEDALYRFGIHLIGLPAGVDPGDFIVSGGTLTAHPSSTRPREVPTFDEAIREYLGKLGHLAESNRSTVGGHLRNLKKKLGEKATAAIDKVKQHDLEEFVQARLRERSSTTVSKERVTLLQFFGWAATAGYLTTSPAANLPNVKARGDLPPFRTLQEIDAVIARGGLSDREILSLWDCLYLSPAQIAELLALVRDRNRHDVSLLLHAIPAYTGMRRGEVLRLRWNDIEFEQDAIVARSKKQSRQAAETTRRIDLHPELKTILLGWRCKRPLGQLVVCKLGQHAELTSRETSTRFYQPLRGTKWCLSSRRDWFKLGFHSYRHSFASNLAAANVDQRIIDEFMGHQTEAMRKRYRHLFPQARRSAIKSFSLSLPGSSSIPAASPNEVPFP